MSTQLQTQPHGYAAHIIGPTDHPIALRETTASARAAQAKALVEARYTVALARPRDIDVVRQKMLKECRRPRFADVARYNKPVGNGITGPSIRFAEMAIRCMGNITIETEVVFEDDEKRIVKVSVTDLEANVPYSQDVALDKTVERRTAKRGDEVIRSRLNKQGETVHIIRATDDEILNKANALISKAVRTLGLRLVPGDLVEECMDEVVHVQKDRDAQDPDAAKRAIYDNFAALGITVDQLKAYLGHDAANLTPKELTDLRGLYAALRDGETSWREIMDSRAPAKDPPGADPGATTQQASDAPRGGNAGLRSRMQRNAAPAPSEPPATQTERSARNQDFPLEGDDDLDASDAPRPGDR